MVRQLAAAALLAVLATHAGAGAAKIDKIGAGVLQGPVSIRTSPRGTLVVLDKRGAGYAVVTFTPAGKVESEIEVPAEIKAPTLAMADRDGTLYFVRQRDSSLWALERGAKPFLIELKGPILGAELQEVRGVESLYLLGERRSGILRMGGGRVEPIVLSKYPARGELVELRLRPNGHIYAYAPAERLVYHFGQRGKFVETLGGGGPAPPKIGVPGDCLTHAYEVDDNGDIYWTLANYGALLRLSADGKTAVHFRGTDKADAPWMGPIHTVVGLALSGKRAYAVDGATKRITAIPKSIVAAGAPDCDTVDTRVFGCSFKVLADTPYKLFTGAEARLRLAFDQGNRRLQQATVAYVLSDADRRVIQQGKVEVGLSGTAAVDHELPVLRLPRLGWYQLDLALLDGEKTLLERVAYLGRTRDDPQLPIPAREQTGWHDLATHRMLGLGLHRFAGNMKQLLEEQRPFIEQAHKLGVPHFVQISDERDCTPDNVKAILAQYPDLPLLEIVNEPNLRMKVDDYVKLLRPCHEAARSVSAKVRVLGPAQCGSELGWFEAFLKAGGGQHVDAVSFHSYERHNSMDPYHWGWKLPKLRALLDAHGLKDKPLYQTEHGFMGDYHGLLVRPLWQARSLYLETMLMERNRIEPERYFYYYVNQGGFRGFSAYLVTAERELLPAALLLRCRAQQLGARRFTEALDFGTPGNWLVLGNRYSGPEGDVVSLVNCGAYKPIPVSLKLPAGARILDAFGNGQESAGRGGDCTLEIGRLPTYIALPSGTRLEAKLADFGRNVAPEAKVVVDDPAAQKTAERLTNGRLEFDFENEPERVGLQASADKLPLEITLELGRSRPISSVIVYGSLADNDKCTPLEYDVLVRRNDGWHKVDEVNVDAEGKVLKHGNFARSTWYDNPWIFVHRFAPIEADALKLHFKRTTFGQHATEQFSVDITRTGLRPRVELREVQVFSAR